MSLTDDDPDSVFEAFKDYAQAFSEMARFSKRVPDNKLYVTHSQRTELANPVMTLYCHALRISA